MEPLFHGFQQLKSGNLSFLYREGEIRQVRYGGTCLLHGIYAAVRDRNWGTLIPVIEKEEISEENGKLSISLDLRYESKEILFRARTAIGGEGNRLWFRFEGVAERDFLRNRIGICVLHPIEECRGKPLRVHHPGGSNSQGRFPEMISARQPFKNISGMVWSPRKGMEGELEFQGEIFEMEDQRNWTDASYKTYGTPLDIPFPALVEEGTPILQRADLQVRAPRIPATVKQKESVVIRPQMETPVSFPAIGISRPPGRESMTIREARIISEIPFSHLRADLQLASNHWKETYGQIHAEQQIMGRPVELALHFPERSEEGLNDFLHAYREAPLPLARILIFDQQHLTGSEFTRSTIPSIKQKLPGIPVGGGSDAHFTELNRNPPDTGSLDFVCYTISPQVHAFDNLTLVENVRAQSDTVRSAATLLDLPVAITAVSLKQRFNPAATDPEGSQSAQPEPDLRQHTLFGAGWTLACLNTLIGSGATSVTLYETVGSRGVLNNIEEGPMKSPQFHLLKELLGGEQLRYLPSVSQDPLRVICLLAEARSGRSIYLANHTESECRVDISGIADALGKGQSFQITALYPDGWREAATSVHPPGVITLGPFRVLKVVK